MTRNKKKGRGKTPSPMVLYRVSREGKTDYLQFTRTPNRQIRGLNVSSR